MQSELGECQYRLPSGVNRLRKCFLSVRSMTPPQVTHRIGTPRSERKGGGSYARFTFALGWLSLERDDVRLGLVKKIFGKLNDGHQIFGESEEPDEVSIFVERKQDTPCQDAVLDVAD